MEEDKKQSQKYPEDKYKSFEETETFIPRIEADGRGINRLKPYIGGNHMRPRLVRSFSKSSNPKE